jgi:hypothetical protein
MLDARGAILALAMVLGACSALRSTPATRYRYMLLNARDLGAEALRLEMHRDPGLREYVARAGEPDFIVLGGETDVELVYVQPSRLVHVHREAPGHAGTVQEVTPIPTGLLQILPRDLRAGTPRPLKTRGCWSVGLQTTSCRTCCATRTSCVTDCGQDGSTETPRQNAM